MKVYLVRLKSSINQIEVEAENYTCQPGSDYHFFNTNDCGKQILVSSFRYKDVVMIRTAPEIKVVKK